MILYNVTVMINPQIEEEWINYMKTEHILDVLNTGLVLEHRFCRITFPEPDEKYTSYAIQYWFESQEKFDEYTSVHAKKLQAEHRERYHNQFITIRSVMETI